MQWLLQSTSPQISNLCTIQVDRVRKFSNQNEKQAETVYATCFFLKDLHQALNLREEKGSEKMTWKRILENAGIDIGFFLLYAAWVRSRAEHPSVSYTKVVMEVAWTGHNLQFIKTN